MPKLTKERYELFAQNMARGMTQERAYVASGFWSDNEDARRARASELCSKPIVAKRIKELQAHSAKLVAEEAIITAREVLSEMKRIALSDVGELFDEKGKLKPFDQMPPDARRAISSVEVDELFEGYGKEREQIGVTKKVRLWDKNRSLENLAKHLKLLTDKVEHSGKVTLEELVCGSKETK